VSRHAPGLPLGSARRRSSLILSPGCIDLGAPIRLRHPRDATAATAAAILDAPWCPHRHRELIGGPQHPQPGGSRAVWLILGGGGKRRRGGQVGWSPWVRPAAAPGGRLHDACTATVVRPTVDGWCVAPTAPPPDLGVARAEQDRGESRGRDVSAREPPWPHRRWGPLERAGGWRRWA